MSESFNLRSGHEVTLKFDNDSFKFVCLEECSSCCYDHKIPLSPYDIHSLCKKLKLNTEAFLKEYTYFTQDEEFNNTVSCNLKLKGPCELLKNGKCSVYDTRPFLCRAYPVGVVFGPEKNSYYFHEKTCPGLNQGKNLNLGEYYRASISEEHEKHHKKWILLRQAIAKLDIPQTEKYRKRFVNICYNFDGSAMDMLIERFQFQHLDRLDAVYKIAVQALKKPAE